MQCPQCQQENPLGTRVCNSCGAGLELTCPSCRHSNRAGSLVCNRGYARFRAPRCASYAISALSVGQCPRDPQGDVQHYRLLAL